MKGLLFLLVILSSGLLVSCSTDQKRTDEKKVQFVGSDSLVDRAELKFKDASEEATFDKVRSCWVASTSTGQWAHFPLRKVGGFVKEDWCTGPNSARGCAGGNFRRTAGAQWAVLNTLHFNGQWPQVFGLGVNTGKIPKEDGWGAQFYLSANGKSITGDSVSVSFLKMAAGKVDVQVHLGGQYTYEIHESRFQQSAPGSEMEVLRLLRSSPDALQNEAIAHLDALESKVLADLDGGKVNKCVYGEYEGGGVPPECIPTPLSEDETSQARHQTRTHFEAQRTLIKEHRVLFHSLLNELAPPNCLP